MKRMTRTLLTSSFLWGAGLSAGFYGLIFSGVLDSPMVRRYFASHPVEYVIGTMFFIGMAAVVIKLVGVLLQSGGMDRPILEPVRSGGEPVGSCLRLLEQLDDAADFQQDGYRVRRLRSALEFVRRNGAAEGLNDELKYLAEEDAAESYAGYGLVRMIIWAIPILGFLGTVIGIALAMGNLNPEALSESMRIVMGGLTVAFDTTALALALSIVLYFSQFLAERQENQLLARIDRLIEREMVGRFEQLHSTGSGELAAVRRMIETLVESSDQLVRRQAAIWRETMEKAEDRHARLANESGRMLGTAIQEGLNGHTKAVGAIETQLAEQGQQNWRQMQQTLVRHTEAIGQLRKESTAQVEMLGRAIEATGQVTQLEDRLNHNLAALAGAGNFEQTLDGLSAAIHLLNSRLGQTAPGAQRVKLDPATPGKGHAA